MHKAKIFKIFRAHYGSQAWASAVLGVPRPHISAWLRDKRKVSKLDSEMPRLAQLIQDTHGECLLNARGEIERRKNDTQK